MWRGQPRGQQTGNDLLSTVLRSRPVFAVPQAVSLWLPLFLLAPDSIQGLPQLGGDDTRQFGSDGAGVTGAPD